MANVSTTTKTDYGPLAALIGVWEGDKGIDVAPEPEGSEEHPYYETMTFEASGDLKNAKKQVLAIVRYLQIVHRKSNHEVFHDQTGYWMWDASAGVVIQSLAIPRALCLVAAGRYRGAAKPKGKIELQVSAKLSDPDWGIVQSPFLRDHARTTEFRHTVTIRGNRMTYTETTMLEIYGRIFEHTDANVLVRKSKRS